MKCGGVEMRLRNKKTGLVHGIIGVKFDLDGKWSFMSLLNGRKYTYNSMDEVKKEWEDPKSDK